LGTIGPIFQLTGTMHLVLRAQGATMIAEYEKMNRIWDVMAGCKHQDWSIQLASMIYL
jgi:hypothetical protein